MDRVPTAWSLYLYQNWKSVGLFIGLCCFIDMTYLSFVSLVGYLVGNLWRTPFFNERPVQGMLE
jgi:hypothetical protein